MGKKIKIAIDGPIAAGKGTVGKILAQKLGITFVDTGAMYRAAALLSLRNGFNFKNDEDKIVKLLKKSVIEIKPVDPSQDIPCLVFLNGENVSYEIRSQKVSRASSNIALLPRVRRVLAEKQKVLARSSSVIMEGRDITTKVLPQADLKIFLTADQQTRVRRRQKQLKKQGVKVSFAQVLEETKKRDYQDSHRQTDSLKIAPDAFVLDTTNLTVNEVVEKILEKVRGITS